MENVRHLLMAKARAIALTVEKMGEERMRQPSGSYGSDYNDLLRNTDGAFPDLYEFLPPTVLVLDTQKDAYTVENYLEIASHCEQICQLLATLGDEDE